MNITLLIPTYRRPQDLIRCLESLPQQERVPDEILVVARNTDSDTHEALAQFKKNVSSAAAEMQDILARLKVADVSVPGQVAALNVGVQQATGDVIAITDDDAVPHAHWLARIEQHFLSDPKVGGVGGRDWLYFGEKLQAGERSIVGRLRWFGARIGNHHLGTGQVRSVEILKGANMSYRRQAINSLNFEEKLRGSGAQVHNDLDFSLSVKKAGWTLLYDPEVSIDHLAGERFDADQRHQFNALAFGNAVHNETLALLKYLPTFNQPGFWLWALLVGNRDAFGLIQLLRFLPSEGSLAIQKWWLSLSGRWQGYRTWAQQG